MARIFVHPGWVRSKNDGDRHFIGFMQLCQLFKLNPGECINMHDPANEYGHGSQDGDRHYFPLYNGNYPLFDKED